MDFDGGSLIASFVVSAIGLVIAGYGKRMQRLPHIAVGLILVGFPYLVSDVRLMAAIAAVLLLALWLAVRRGL